MWVNFSLWCASGAALLKVAEHVIEGGVNQFILTLSELNKSRVLTGLCSGLIYAAIFLLADAAFDPSNVCVAFVFYYSYIFGNVIAGFVCFKKWLVRFSFDDLFPTYRSYFALCTFDFGIYFGRMCGLTFGAAALVMRSSHYSMEQYPEDWCSPGLGIPAGWWGFTILVIGFLSATITFPSIVSDKVFIRREIDNSEEADKQRLLSDHTQVDYARSRLNGNEELQLEEELGDDEQPRSHRS